MAQGRAVMRLMGHKRAITAVCITKGGRIAISGGVDTRVMVWDLKQQKRVLQFKNHGFGIRALGVGPNVHSKSKEDDLVVISGDERGAVMVWTLCDGEILTCLLEDSDDGEERNAVNDVAISPDGTTAIVATEDRSIRVFDLVSQKQTAMAVLESVDQEITNISMCGNGGVFAASHEDRLDLWTVDWILKRKGTTYGLRSTSSKKLGR
jgi:WD40 repeat protein